jgi:SnoaL-like domain
MTSRNDVQRAAALDELLDKAELRELAMRYARAIDRCDRTALLELYHEDAIDHHGAGFRGTPLEFADYVQKTGAAFEVSAHYILNTRYVCAGDRAEGELYFVAYHRTRPPSPQEITVAGRYLDRYERRSGVWKISRRSLVWDWADTTPMASAALQLLRSLGEGGSQDKDSSYGVLPLLAALRKS